MIIDQDDTLSDPQVLTGSMNWSNNSELRSDENTLIIHDWKIANQFYQEFAARVIFASQLPCSLTVSNRAAILNSERLLNAAPNPAESMVRLQSLTATPAQLSITDLLGRTIYSTQINGAGELSIDTKNWQKGIYIINARAAEKVQTLRLMVK